MPDSATLLSQTSEQTYEPSLETTLVEEIQQYLTDATGEQVKRFAVQVERLNNLEKFFKRYPDLIDHFREPLNRAAKALNYKRPYRIAMIGTTGAGKSTLINAVLGRRLVLTKAIGKPATGAALEIFLDVTEGGEEYATIAYRDEANIRQLVADFVDRYGLDGSDLKGKFDTEYCAALARLEPATSLNEQARREFIELQKTLVDIVKQYTNHNPLTLKTQFALSDPKDERELMELIDEHSPLNSEIASTRKIGLIKSVTYRIKQPQSVDHLPTLNLPGNVCLVDLPGLDGSPLHDIIISEGIREADAVVFILRPPRVLGRGDAYLLDRVRKYISIEGSVESGERIFLVLNAKDIITSDHRHALDNLPRDMQDLMNLLVPGYAQQFSTRGGNTPYFQTSAWAAYAAQKILQGESIDNRSDYDAIKLKLGIEGASDREVLAASQVPLLVEELTRFACDHRIEGQIRDGKQSLDSIVETLCHICETEKHRLTDNRGKFYFQEKVEQMLTEQQQDLEDIIIDFRGIQLERFETWQKQLETLARSICDETDRVLRDKMPQVWKEAYRSRRIPTSTHQVAKPIFEFILSQTQVYLWEQLTINVPLLARHLVRVYLEGLEAYQMAQKIAGSSYSTVEVQQLRNKIKEVVETSMYRSMTQVSERLALTQMTDPGSDFTTMGEDGRPVYAPLFETILRVPRQKNVESHHFNELISGVRSQYESFVSNYCITALLNLYRYEMIQVENILLDIVRQSFYSIRNTDSPLLRQRIYDNLADPNLQRVEQLEQQLEFLSYLRDV